MEPERKLTFYRSSTGWLILLGGALTFAVIGALILLVDRPLQMSDVIMAWITIAFFGLCALVSARAIREDRRAPLLQITPEGVTCPYSRFPLPVAGWSDIRSFALYQWTRKRASNRTSYYLAITARSPGGLRDPEEDDTVEWPMAPDPPEEDGVAMLVPLDDLSFSNTRPDRLRARTLDRVKCDFAPEIAQHSVTIAESIRAL